MHAPGQGQADGARPGQQFDPSRPAEGQAHMDSRFERPLVIQTPTAFAGNSGRGFIGIQKWTADRHWPGTEGTKQKEACEASGRKQKAQQHDIRVLQLLGSRVWGGIICRWWRLRTYLREWDEGGCVSLTYTFAHGGRCPFWTPAILS